MRYLGLALYAEGSTDYHFLRPLLQRLCAELCASEALTLVEVSEVLALNHPSEANEEAREQRVLAAAKEAQGSWQILFVHADGASDPMRARDEQVEPSLGLLRDAFESEGIGVAVVPVRETEAWAIVDGDAIRSAFGTNLNDGQLGLPSRRAVETAADPKAVLRAAFLATKPSGRRRKQGASPYLNTLGEEVSLDQLRELGAFKRLTDELRAALKQLQILG
jgi:hypothetical protein